MSKEWEAFWAMVQLPVMHRKRSTIQLYVNTERESVDWPALSEEMAAWSHGEQVLMRLAHALFNEEEDLPIHELKVLDPENGRAVLEIIRRRYW